MNYWNIQNNYNNGEKWSCVRNQVETNSKWDEFMNNKHTCDQL